MQINTFKARLDSVLKDNAITRYTGGKKKGKVDFKKIYKISMTDKIFKQKQERKGKDYSVTFLLDNSDSMFRTLPVNYEDSLEDMKYYSPADEVGKIVEDLCKVLDIIHIPNSVYAFGKYTNLVKRFDESSKDVGEKYINCFDENSNYNTYDALALHIVGNEICNLKKKNILVVITDGDGDVFREDSSIKVHGVRLGLLGNAKTVLNGLRKKYQDLEVVCLSIGLTKAKKIYGAQRTYQVQDAISARKGIITLLNKIIKRGA